MQTLSDVGGADLRASEATVESDHGPRRLMAKRVLVSEDDPSIRQLVRDVLEIEGHLVEETMGADTLVCVEREHPDVIMLDYMMPGLDGIQIAARLHQNESTRDIPIIAMTAMDRAPMVCREMQASGCIGKPFDIADLLEVVGQVGHRAH